MIRNVIDHTEHPFPRVRFHELMLELALDMDSPEVVMGYMSEAYETNYSPQYLSSVLARASSNASHGLEQRSVLPDDAVDDADPETVVLVDDAYRRLLAVCLSQLDGISKAQTVLSAAADVREQQGPRAAAEWVIRELGETEEPPIVPDPDMPS